MARAARHLVSKSKWSVLTKSCFTFIFIKKHKISLLVACEIFFLLFFSAFHTFLRLQLNNSQRHLADPFGWGASRECGCRWTAGRVGGARGISMFLMAKCCRHATCDNWKCCQFCLFFFFFATFFTFFFLSVHVSAGLVVWLGALRPLGGHFRVLPQISVITVMRH